MFGARSCCGEFSVAGQRHRAVRGSVRCLPLWPLPGLALKRTAQRRCAVAEYGLAVRGEDVLDLQGGQALERWQVTFAPPAAAAFVVQRVVPHAQLTAACLDDGVAEDEGAVGWDLDRLLGAGRAADRVEAGDTTDVTTAGHGLEPRGIA